MDKKSDNQARIPFHGWNHDRVGADFCSQPNVVQLAAALLRFVVGTIVDLFGGVVRDEERSHWSFSRSVRK